MGLKSHRVDLQKMYKELVRTGRRAREYDGMLSAELYNIFYDPCFLYRNYWEIDNLKTGRRIVFEPWDAQVEILEALNSGHLYWVLLKARRLGMTEIFVRECLKDALLGANQNIIVLSKNQVFADDFVRKIKSQHNWLIGRADYLRSPIYRDNVDMIHFGYKRKDEYGNEIVCGRDSIIRAYPRGESVAVGATATKVIWDEAALQPNSHELFAYTLPVVEGTGAEFIISSTARGFGNKHSQLYKQAVSYWERGQAEHKTRFKPLFAGYFVRPDRSESTWEADLREIGDINKCRQEFPRTPDEAFQASSYCVFDVKALEYILDSAPLKPEGYGQLTAFRPQLTEGIYGKCETDSIKFVATEWGGEVKIYKYYNVSHKYIAGIDCAMSLGQGDYTVCQIFDLHTGEQCAVYRARKNPEQCANDIEVLCKFYGEPLAVIEKDGPGLAFLQRFRQIYDKIHGREQIDGIVDKVNYQKLGTSVRGATKEAYIGLVQIFISNSVNRDKSDYNKITGRSGFGWLNDPVTIEECLNYVRAETGKMGADKDAKMDSASEGSEPMHDDTVMGLVEVCIGIKDRGRQYEEDRSKPVNMTEADKVWEKAGFFKKIQKAQFYTKDKEGTNRIINQLSKSRRGIYV